MQQRLNVYAITGMIFLALSACDSSDPRQQSSPSAPLVESIQDTIAAADFSEDSYYEKTYRDAEPKYWLRIAGWITEHALERRFIEGETQTTILDLGCGYGTLLAFATSNYAGAGICFDVIPFVQPSVQESYGIKYTKLDIERDAFPQDLQVDVVLMTEVIEHLNFHPRTTLAKIFKVLKPGGSFLISTPDADAGWGRVYDYYESIEEMPAPILDAEWIDGHIWQYTEQELRAVLENAGFKIKRLEHAPGAVGKHFNVWAVKPQP